MPEIMKNNKWIYVRWFLIRFLLIVYDILAINLAHYMALVIRFYVASEFHSVAPHYIEAYGNYLVFYTVFCLVVFCCLKLYSGIWKYAGFNDLNRILGASFICFAGHVAGTLMFNCRMPITFYCIGAALQLCMITASRFFYRLVLAEKNKVFGSKNAKTRAMVVGTGPTAKMVIRELEQEEDIRLMCVLNYKNVGLGSLFNGVPVINDLSNLKNSVEKYQINYVIIASASMHQEIRNQIKDLCKTLNVEAQDYSGFFQSTGSYVAFRSLAECIDCPLEVMIQDRHLCFQDGKHALRNMVGRYMVKSLRAVSGGLMIELDEYSVVQNDLNAEWVRNQEMETGEAISFF